MKGVITHIQRYSIHDGPGIRTVVFLKGCPLSCLWCCNPETQSFEPELEYIQSLCAKCGKCLAVCPENAVNPDLNCVEDEKIIRHCCTICEKCVIACPSTALRIIGEERTVEQILDEVLRDRAFYRRSGGGVTLSGGEPLAQPEFAIELIKACHAHNLHTAIETSGLVSLFHLQQIISSTDLFLFDVKYIKKTKHIQWTGVLNETILTNLKWLMDQNGNVILRIPSVPGYTTDESNLQDLVMLVNDLKIREVDLMPFHQLGRDKYHHFGKPYLLGELVDMRVSDEGKQILKGVINAFKDCNAKMIVGG